MISGVQFYYPLNIAEQTDWFFMNKKEHAMPRRNCLWILGKSKEGTFLWVINILRERFWILGCHISIRQLLWPCVTSRGYKGKHLDTSYTLSVFQVMGIDFRCTLHLKICYYALYFNLVSNLSMNVFLQSFWRMVTSNCINSQLHQFRGCKSIAWDKLERNCEVKFHDSNTMEVIDPTSAPWWERIMRF